MYYQAQRFPLQPFAHSPSSWIAVEPHGKTHADELCTDSPYVLAVCLAECEILEIDEKAFDQFEGACFRL